MSALSDAVAVGLIAGAASGVVAVVGGLLLHAQRRRSLRVLIPLVALVSVLSVLAGAIGTAQAMFLSEHDFQVLVVVVLSAGTVGLTSAVLLGHVVVRSSRLLSAAARALAHGSYEGVDAVLPAELAALDGALRQTSRRLAGSRASEQLLENSRRELVAWVSHDLRSPLAGIRAMSEALEDGVVCDPDTVARYHRGIRLEADRLAQMVDDLFELSRINAHALRLTLEQVPLADLISDALASAAPIAAAKGVQLTGDAGTETVHASASELGRVLRNLLANAIRHTPADGVVHICARVEAGSAYLEVADACGGIPAADLTRVFDVAFRGTAARTPGDEGGGGLGLAIARGLVEAHAGEISIVNDGPGCRVVVRLPVGTAL